MGFLDTAKDLAKKAKCTVGFHSGNFSHTPEKPECNFSKICPDCNKHIEQIKHEFGEWEFIQENKCDVRRECIHCSEEEKTIAHQWSQEKSQCDVYEICFRCSARKFLRKYHAKWLGGVGHPDGTQTFFCSECGETERRKFDPSA